MGTKADVTRNISRKVCELFQGLYVSFLRVTRGYICFQVSFGLIYTQKTLKHAQETPKMTHCKCRNSPPYLPTVHWEADQQLDEEGEAEAELVQATGHGEEGDEVLEDGDEAPEAEGGVDCDQATDQLQVPRPGLSVQAVEDNGAEAGEAAQQHGA